MGHVTVQVTISNPSDPALQATADALVDTGPTLTVLPRALAIALELPVTGESTVRTATGDVRLDRARAFIGINGRSEINPVLISDTVDRPLIGAVTLETLSLAVDSTTGQLNEGRLLLY